MKMEIRWVFASSLITSVAGLCFSATGVPFVWQAILHRWKPAVDGSVAQILVGAFLLLMPFATVRFFRRHPEQKKSRIGRWTERLAILSACCLAISIAALLVLHFLPARQGIAE